MTCAAHGGENASPFIEMIPSTRKRTLPFALIWGLLIATLLWKYHIGLTDWDTQLSPSHSSGKVILKWKQFLKTPDPLPILQQHCQTFPGRLPANPRSKLTWHSQWEGSKCEKSTYRVVNTNHIFCFCQVTFQCGMGLFGSP